MKRLWIGIGLLIILLVFGIVSTVAMSDFHETISRQLAQAGSAALTEDWSQAQLLISQARSTWLSYRDIIAAVASHGPMEEIDEYFAKLMVCFQERDRQNFSVCCATLSAKALALGETHSVTWWSLL